MYQQTYCHTLLQPFFKIFLFRIYAPTIHSTDIDFDETSVSGLHTSPRQSSHHKPIHQRHSPPNLHVHTTHKPIHQRHSPPNLHVHTTHKPIHQRPQTHKPNHRYHTPQIPQPYSPTNTYSPTNAQRHPLDAAQAPVDVDVDADDVPTLMQHRCSRSHAPVRNSTGQADRIRPYKTRPDRIRPPIHN